jgi:hypothetical protein
MMGSPGILPWGYHLEGAITPFESKLPLHLEKVQSKGKSQP